MGIQIKGGGSSSSGITIGAAVGGGTPNDILYVDSSGLLGQDDNFNFQPGYFGFANLLNLKAPSGIVPIIAASGDGAGPIIAVTAATSAFDSGSYIGSKSRGTIASPTVTMDGDTLFTFSAFGYNTANTQSGSASATILFFQDGASSAGQAPGGFKFLVSTTSATGQAALTVKADKKISIGGIVASGFAPSGDFHQRALAAADIVHIIQGASSQTGNLTEWWNSASSVLASMSATGILTLGVAGTQTGTLKLKGTTSGTVTIQTAAAAGTYTLTLPVDDGTANQFLQTDGGGILSWAASSATPGGSNKQVQFNDGGVFGGDAGLTYDKATDTLSAIYITSVVDQDLHLNAIGTSVDTGFGASINIRSSDGLIGGTGTELNGGDVTVFTGQGQTTDGNGGNLSFGTGSGDGLGNAGTIDFSVGNAGNDANGSAIRFFAGDGGAGAGGGYGGNVEFQAGSGQVAGTSGGNIIINVGEPGAGGTKGGVFIGSLAGIYTVLDTSLVVTSDKTFTFPNVTGTIYVGSTTSAPSTTVTPTFTSYYGGNTKAMGDPVTWATIKLAGTTYKVPLYT